MDNFTSDGGQIVARNGSMSWTRDEVSAAFTAVQNKENWKARIDAVVTLADDRALLGMREAVIFFTGSIPTFDALGQNRYRVRAAGYYVAIGA